ncbi:hypothetical protein LPB72_07080 [Hydrogenophaga crassostreae]|uniref:Transposase zinc-binding domain-containing protein n=1 Tax=Hydrogenophaga crassostreae TaxID=1763535 RepID=A0A167IFP6_9BURK|nr:hypothetical protein LPB072_10295 [Hydrogenophaga crassostreae]OAD42667.1 hypothetical protein LPB72_07080 [Hydrogenophaga crassostreae]
MEHLEAILWADLGECMVRGLGRGALRGKGVKPLQGCQRRNSLCFCRECEAEMRFVVHCAGGKGSSTDPFGSGLRKWANRINWIARWILWAFCRVLPTLAGAV